jgi:hypothetical protein
VAQQRKTAAASTGEVTASPTSTMSLAIDIHERAPLQVNEIYHS